MHQKASESNSVSPICKEFLDHESPTNVNSRSLNTLLLQVYDLWLAFHIDR